MARIYRNFPKLYDGKLFSSNIPVFDDLFGLHLSQNEVNTYTLSGLTHEVNFSEFSGSKIFDTKRLPVQEEVYWDLSNPASDFVPTASGLIFTGNSIQFRDQYIPADSGRLDPSQRLRSTNRLGTYGSFYVWCELFTDNDPSRERCIFSVSDINCTDYNSLNPLFYFGFYIQNNKFIYKQSWGMGATALNTVIINEINPLPGKYLISSNAINGIFYINDLKVFSWFPYSFTSSSNPASIQFLMDCVSPFRYGYNIRIYSYKHYNDSNFTRQDFRNIYKAGIYKSREYLKL